MGIGSLMPHLLGVPVWDGEASASVGANALCLLTTWISFHSEGQHRGGGG
jgi:hypothetical protein